MTSFNVKGVGVCWVDDVDEPLLASRWKCHKRKWTTYLSTRKFVNGKAHTVSLHRAVMERIIGRSLEKNEQVDHKDGNGLNNSRANLRLCTPAQNMQNRRVKSNTVSGFKGVTKVAGTYKRPWQAAITLNGKRKYLGCFPTPEEAHEAYCKAAREHFGEFFRAA